MREFPSWSIRHGQGDKMIRSYALFISCTYIRLFMRWTVTVKLEIHCVTEQDDASSTSKKSRSKICRCLICCVYQLDLFLFWPQSCSTALSWVHKRVGIKSPGLLAFLFSSLLLESSWLILDINYLHGNWWFLTQVLMHHLLCLLFFICKRSNSCSHTSSPHRLSVDRDETSIAQGSPLQQTPFSRTDESAPA